MLMVKITSEDLDRLLWLRTISSGEHDIDDLDEGEQAEFQTLIDKFELAEKHSNELRSTHHFYLKSKNGFCSGVTKQIIELSSYGGKLIDSS